MPPRPLAAPSLFALPQPADSICLVNPEYNTARHSRQPTAMARPMHLLAAALLLAALCPLSAQARSLAQLWGDDSVDPQALAGAVTAADVAALEQSCPEDLFDNEVWLPVGTLLNAVLGLCCCH